MRDILYDIISFILLLFLISLFVFIFTDNKQYKLSKDKNGIIIHKTESVIFGDHIHLMVNDSTIEQIGCYNILFHEVEVGDTIVNGQIKRKNNQNY